ncbi:MAG: hypothetical protein ACJA2S_003984 [Cyclobacteriaceae bacterium]|jgi:uncharacterized protein involved in tolerance to divalent cations
MVNVIIYLKKEHDAKELVKFLLTERLIGSASIDQNNVSYKLVDSQFSEEVYSVITAQSKSLLFNKIVDTVEEKIGEETPINSTPIVGSNRMFDHFIKENTILI